MEAQANTAREQSNKKNIYDVGWQLLKRIYVIIIIIMLRRPH